MKPSQLAELQAQVDQQSARLAALQAAANQKFGPWYNVGGHLISRQRREQLLAQLSGLQRGLADIRNRLTPTRRW